MDSRQCASLATCALLAINVTAGLLGLNHASENSSSFSAETRHSDGSERDCSVLAAYAKGFSPAEQQLLFGHPAGLRMQPEDPKGRCQHSLLNPWYPKGMSTYMLPRRDVAFDQRGRVGFY